ncbi:hypothetical protein ABPG75_011315 [Micractinium tetrahymenae]
MAPCPLLGLPDELLTYIVELAGKREGPSLTLVCKRLRGIYFSVPSFWQELKVLLPKRRTSTAESQHWADAWLSLLQRVAGMVEALCVKYGSELARTVSAGMTARFLRCLAPAAATEVRLQGFNDSALPTDAVASLAALTQLQRLHLSSSELPANTASTLCQVSSSLRSLLLEVYSTPLPLVEVLPQLTQLTCLELRSKLPLPRCDW